MLHPDSISPQVVAIGKIADAHGPRVELKQVSEDSQSPRKSYVLVFLAIIAGLTIFVLGLSERNRRLRSELKGTRRRYYQRMLSALGLLNDAARQGAVTSEMVTAVAQELLPGSFEMNSEHDPVAGDQST